MACKSPTGNSLKKIPDYEGLLLEDLFEADSTLKSRIEKLEREEPVMLPPVFANLPEIVKEDDSIFSVSGEISRGSGISASKIFFDVVNNKIYVGNYAEGKITFAGEDGNYPDILSEWLELFKPATDKKENKLIGIWHDEPMASSALGGTITFFPDNTYIIRGGEGTNEKQQYIKGTYKINKGMIMFHPQKEGILEGAKMEYVVHLDDSVLSGGTIVEKAMVQEAFQQTISEVEFSEEMQKNIVKIGKMEYYQLDNNPNENYWD